MTGYDCPRCGAERTRAEFKAGACSKCHFEVFEAAAEKLREAAPDMAKALKLTLGHIRCDGGCHSETSSFSNTCTCGAKGASRVVRAALRKAGVE